MSEQEIKLAKLKAILNLLRKHNATVEESKWCYEKKAGGGVRVTKQKKGKLHKNKTIMKVKIDQSQGKKKYQIDFIDKS